MKVKVSRSELRADRAGNKLIEKTLSSQQPPVGQIGAPPVNVITQGLNAKVVKYVERMLKLAGFNPGVVDNKFSANTTAALKAFQKSVGLPETGSLDKSTFNRLRRVQTRIRENGFSGIYSTGQKSGGIKKLEQRLNKLGYATKADGIYDAQTAQAMKAFRADQKNLNDNAGYAGQKAQKVLKQEADALSHPSYRGRARRTKDRLRLNAATDKAVKEATDEQGEKGIGVGAKGRAVKNIQGHLLAAGFDPKNTGGNFDERTAAALKAFQRRNGLKPTGLVNAQTWKKLKGSVALVKPGSNGPAQALYEKSATVKRTEKLMKKLGFNPGKVDGIFDRRMLKSVKKMQKSLGLKVDGTIGANDIKKMKQAAKGVTLGQLRKIMPSLPLSKARQYLPLLNRAMAEGKINTVKRKAAFLAQLAHESVQLRYFEEIASGAAYEGRRDLGNVRPGDGRRYKGRGPIQLTGRANYRAAGRALRLPLEKNPRLASRPDVGFRIAVWFWSSRGLNGLADKGAFTEITRRINGGYNGLSARRQYYARALRALR